MGRVFHDQHKQMIHTPRMLCLVQRDSFNPTSIYIDSMYENSFYWQLDSTCTCKSRVRHALHVPYTFLQKQNVR